MLPPHSDGARNISNEVLSIQQDIKDGIQECRSLFAQSLGAAAVQQIQQQQNPLPLTTNLLMGPGVVCQITATIIVLVPSLSLIC